MTDSKPVNGIICIPIPPLTEGEHTLSTTYEDAEYQSANKCFKIKVASANAVITADRSTANPNCTVNLVAHLTNSLDMPIVGTTVKFSLASADQDGYNGSSTSLALARTIMASADSEGYIPLGTDVSDENGIVSIPVTIPTNIRAGLIKVKVAITQSPDGYTNGSKVLLPLYIKREGNIQLKVYPKVDDAYSSTSLSNGDTVDDGTILKLESTLYDGSDSGKIPLPDVPISTKVNGVTLTADKVAGQEDLTNADGKVSVSPVEVNFSQNTFTVNTKNADYPFIGSDEVTFTFNIREEIIFSNFRDASNYSTDHIRYVFRLRDKRGNALSGANAILKIQGVTCKNDEDEPIKWTADENGYVTVDYQVPFELASSDMNGNERTTLFNIIISATGMMRYDHQEIKVIPKRTLDIDITQCAYTYIASDDPDNVYLGTDYQNELYVAGEILVAEKNAAPKSFSNILFVIKANGLSLYEQRGLDDNYSNTNEANATVNSHITYYEFISGGAESFYFTCYFDEDMVLPQDALIEFKVGENTHYTAVTASSQLQH